MNEKSLFEKVMDGEITPDQVDLNEFNEAWQEYSGTNQSASSVEDIEMIINSNRIFKERQQAAIKSRRDYFINEYVVEKGITVGSEEFFSEAETMGIGDDIAEYFAEEVHCVMKK